MEEAGRGRRDENRGNIRSYGSLERRHDGVACACDVAVAQRAGQTKSPQKPADRRRYWPKSKTKKSTENEEREVICRRVEKNQRKTRSV